MNEGTRGTFKVRSLALGDNFAQVLRAVTLTLTNSQVKNVRATPITIVGAPLAGFLVMPVACLCELVYGGTNAFTSAAGDVLALKWKDGTTSPILQGAVQAFVQGTASAYSYFVPQASTNVTKANSDGQPLVIHNITASEIAGNAGNDNTLRFTLTYAIVPSV